MTVLEKKVTNLEEVMRDLMYVFTRSQREHEEFKEESQMYREELHKEMLEFKNEMKEFKKDSNKKWGNELREKEFDDVIIYENSLIIKDKRIRAIFSSLNIPSNFVSYFTRNNIYAMAMREVAMELINCY